MKEITDDVYVVSRERCPSCATRGLDTSADNLTLYNDGHKYCFGCGYYERSNGKMEVTMREVKPFSPYKGECVSITDRRIDASTTRRYDYQTCMINGSTVELANFYQDGALVGQHMRGPNKKFHWNGNSSQVTLWGQQLWKAGGKRLIVTEGEYDCMTVNQLLGGKWPVVSLPSGAAGATRAVKQNLEFVASFNEVVLMFDQDEAGKKAMKQVAELLPPGRCKIASLPYKDANECLLKGAGNEVVNASWQAMSYSPDEILHVSQVLAEENPVESRVYPFPFQNLTEFLIGQRSGEITLWASGTGSGKSTILRELVWHHLEENRSVGAIMLEESPQETIDDIVSLILNKPVRAIRAGRMMNELREKLGKTPIHMDIIDDLTDEEYAQARTQLGETGFYVYDHLGNNGLQNLCSRIEFMAVSLGVDVIVLDHITAAAAGLMGANADFDGGSNERLLIDNIMKELRALVSRTGVRIDVVSQLKKTNKAYEEGDRITLQDLRGSGSLASVPNTVIGLERDRQNPDDRIANMTTIRVLKNRLTGRAGIASTLFFNRTTGRLEEIDFALDDTGSLSFEPV